MSNQIKCYKYMWKVAAKKETLNVKFITGSDNEHKAFKEALQKSPEVLSAVAEYQYTIDGKLLGVVDTLKSEVKKSEVK